MTSQEEIFPTAVKQNQIPKLMTSDKMYDLKKLAHKRLGNHIEIRRIDGILHRGMSDKYIYHMFRDLIEKSRTNGREYIPLNPKWGANTKNVTGRASSRVDEIKNHLPIGEKSVSYVDIGCGNAEISVAVGMEMGLKQSDILVIDKADYRADAFRKTQFLLTEEFSSIALETDTINIVTAFQALHHMKDLDFKLKEIRRILKKGGKLIIREHDVTSWEVAALVDIEHMLYEISIANKDHHCITCDYYAAYRSRECWTKLLEKNGFQLLAYIPVVTKNNPTNYYYAVYQAV